MFTRRIATVTISAPAASVAARVCSRSRYLPLPTSRRERYSLPAMTRAGSPAGALVVMAFMSYPFRRKVSSAAADGAYHVDPVAGAQRGADPALARHHAAVHGQRDGLAGQSQRFHQFLQAG